MSVPQACLAACLRVLAMTCDGLPLWKVVDCSSSLGDGFRASPWLLRIISRSYSPWLPHIIMTIVIVIMMMIVMMIMIIIIININIMITR